MSYQGTPAGMFNPLKGAERAIRGLSRGPMKTEGMSRYQAEGVRMVNAISIAEGALSTVVLFLLVAALFHLTGASFGAMNRAQTWFVMFLVCLGVNVFAVFWAILYIRRSTNDLHNGHYEPFLVQFWYSCAFFTVMTVLVGSFTSRFKDELPVFNDRFDQDLQNGTAVSQSLNLMLNSWDNLLAIFVAGALIYMQNHVKSLLRHGNIIFDSRARAFLGQDGASPVVVGNKLHSDGQALGHMN